MYGIMLEWGANESVRLDVDDAFTVAQLCQRVINCVAAMSSCTADQVVLVVNSRPYCMAHSAGVCIKDLLSNAVDGSYEAVYIGGIRDDLPPSMRMVQPVAPEAEPPAAADYNQHNDMECAWARFISEFGEQSDEAGDVPRFMHADLRRALACVGSTAEADSSTETGTSTDTGTSTTTGTSTETGTSTTTDTETAAAAGDELVNVDNHQAADGELSALVDRLATLGFVDRVLCLAQLHRADGDVFKAAVGLAVLAIRKPPKCALPTIQFD